MTNQISVDYQAAPTIARFHRSDDFVRGLIGPFGSGKSVGCVMEIIRRASEVPEVNGVRQSRWAVVRNSYRELQDTTIQTWREWIPESIRSWRASDMADKVVFGLPDGTRVVLEVLFRALDRPDDIKKLLSLEITGAWINEAREVPKAVFDAIQGRLGRYPRHKTWFGVIADTNPPDTDHWWYRTFEEMQPDGFSIYHQPPGDSPEAENTENLPEGYYERLKAGKDQAWIDVYVGGRYGFVRDGKPIYPEYRDEMHSRLEIEPDPNSPLHIGLDFGLTPAAVIAQEVNGQLRVIDEVITDNMGASRFAPVLKAHLAEHYPNYRIGTITGDPAGDGRSQADENTPFRILRAAGVSANPAQTNDPTIRREAVAGRLMRLTVTGEPALVVSGRAKIIRKGFMGGYKYRRLQVAGDERYEDKPDKNMYSHPHDALQYLCLGIGDEQVLMGGTSTDWSQPINRPRSKRPGTGISIE